jgi:hypothetical protein
LELLESKLGDEGYAVLERLVLEQIHRIEGELNEQEAQVAAAGAASAAGSGVVQGSPEVPVEITGGETWDELPAVPEGPLVDPDAIEEDDPLAAVFNGDGDTEGEAE